MTRDLLTVYGGYFLLILWPLLVWWFASLLARRNG